MDFLNNVMCQVGRQRIPVNEIKWMKKQHKSNVITLLSVKDISKLGTPVRTFMDKKWPLLNYEDQVFRMTGILRKYTSKN